jgi:hypothetical protein
MASCSTVAVCTHSIARNAGLHALTAKRMTAKDFTAGGALSDYALELQLWCGKM